jgi:hypothetical protein
MTGKMIAICLLGAALSLGLATTGELAKAKVPQSQNRQVQSQTQTFTGEVTRTKDPRNRLTPFIIYDRTRKMNYFLDYNGNNQELAKHEGKQVQITGTLSSAETIQVESIKDLADL